MADNVEPDDDYQFDDAKGDPKAAKLGDRYEVVILTHVAICCAMDKTIKEFAIPFNAKDHGNLDDIIVRQDKLLTFIQLKHKTGMCNIKPEYNNYKNTYENKLLPMYKEKIEKGFKLKIIFLSNANVLIPENMNKLPVDEQKEKFFTGKGEVFQIEHQNGASGTAEFYKNLYIFSKQSAYSQCKDMLLNDMNRAVEIDQIIALYDYFQEAVVGRTNAFTKKEILKVLNLFILKPAMLFNDAKILSLNKYLKLFKNLLSFKLIIVTEKYKNLLFDLINQCLIDNLEFDSAVNYKNEIPQSLLDKVNKTKGVGVLLKRNKSPYIFEHLFIALWQIGQIPIVLNYSEYKKQIDYSINHFIAEDEGPITLIVNNHSPAPPTNVSIFRDLTNFDEATRAQFLQQINIKIGKSTWKLNEFIGEEVSTINKVTTDVLISLLCNSFDIDKIDKETPLYIPRKVKIKLLKKDVLTTSSFLFVIDNDESTLDFKTYLADQEKYSNKNVINSKLSLFETNEEMKFINRDYCLLRQFDKDKYMVYGYNGPISSLEEYFEEQELPENKIMDNLSMVNILAADAGMGKTYLLKNAKSYLFDMKLLPIYLNLGDTCKELNSLPQDLTALTSYLADKFTGNYDKIMDLQTVDFFKSALKHNIEERKVVLLLDGFDEAPLDFKVIDFFSSLHIKVIITTRMHRLHPITEHCRCLAFTLMTFTSQDQKDFFNFHYGDVEDEKVEKIIEILNKNIESSLMTIPLQTKHVVEIFTDINRLFEEIDNINVLFLYEKFIEKHLNAFDKGRKINESLIERSACVLMLDPQFSDEFLGIDEDEWRSLVLEFKNENVKNFIITGFNNDIPQFIHRTYAEFLCAKYLAKKKKLSPSVIDRLLKEENLLKVRHFFDIIICQNLKLHSAILMKKSNQIISLLNIEQDREHLLEKLQEKDKFNRTPLHLALSYGHRHSQIYSRYFYNSQSLQSHLDKTETEFMVIQDILQLLTSLTERTQTQFSTDVWDNYPWDYALKTRSFDSLEELLSKFPKWFACEDRKNAAELIFVAAVYDYLHLFNSIEQSGNFTETIIDVDFQNKLSNVLNIEDGRLEKWFLSNICAREGSVKVWETMLRKGLFKINERYNAGNSKLTALETAVNYWNVFSKGQKNPILISMLMKSEVTDVYRKQSEENILHRLAYKIGNDSNNVIIETLSDFLTAHDSTYVDSVNEDGATPLMLAVKYGHSKQSLDFISILTKHNASLDIVDKESCNIWHYFASNNLGSNEIISSMCNYLKKAKHLINNCNKMNIQPLLKIICDKRLMSLMLN